MRGFLRIDAFTEPLSIIWHEESTELLVPVDPTDVLYLESVNFTCDKKVDMKVYFSSRAIAAANAPVGSIISGVLNSTFLEVLKGSFPYGALPGQTLFCQVEGNTQKAEVYARGYIVKKARLE